MGRCTNEGDKHIRTGIRVRYCQGWVNDATTTMSCNLAACRIRLIRPVKVSSATQASNGDDGKTPGARAGARLQRQEIGWLALGGRASGWLQQRWDGVT